MTNEHRLPGEADSGPAKLPSEQRISSRSIGDLLDSWHELREAMGPSTPDLIEDMQVIRNQILEAFLSTLPTGMRPHDLPDGEEYRRFPSLLVEREVEHQLDNVWRQVRFLRQRTRQMHRHILRNRGLEGIEPSAN